MIRVLIVDDQALVRGGLAAILSAQADMEVVGLAKDGSEAIALAESASPDVVLMDVRMPVLDGVEAVRRILSSAATRAKIVMLTTFDLDEYVYDALAAGASGFLLKETEPEVLADAVRTAAGGEALLAPSVLRRLVEKNTSRTSRQRRERLTVLTEREVEVLRLIGRGATNHELAEQLHVAETTVKTHITRIFQKLDLRDRAQAVVLAYETGLVKPGDDGEDDEGA